MAIPWEQYEQKPEFQQLPPEEQQAAQQQYFNEVVAPQVPSGEQDAARQQFFTEFNYGQPVTAAAPEEPGFISTVREWVTGEGRQTRATRELPELSDSGLLAGTDTLKALQVVPAILTAETPEEIADILTSNYQEIGIQWDPKGNLIAANNKTGATGVINKPGQSKQDVLNYLGVGSLLASGGALGSTGKYLGGKIATKAPALAQKVAGAVQKPVKAVTDFARANPKTASALGAGAGTAGIEAYQAASGGEFNKENVFLDMLGTFGFDAALDFFKRSGQRSLTQATGDAETAAREAVEAEAKRIESPVSPESKAEQQEKLFRGLSEEQKRQTSLLQKVAGGPSMALKDVPELVAPSPERIQAAEDLGIDLESVPAAVLSTNDTFIETMQALRSVPGSKLAAEDKSFRRKLANKASELIEEFGGTTSRSDLSDRFKTEVTETIDTMYEKSEALYNQISQLIPANTRHKPESTGGYSFAKKQTGMKNLGGYLSEKSHGLGGDSELSSLERSLLKMAQSNPTYAKMDYERKKIGNAIHKKSGVYKDEELGTLKKLYSEITKDQEIIARDKGAGDLWDLAKKEVQQRKTLEENTITLLGKDVTGALMPKVGKAVRKLEKGDYEAFDKIMGALPNEYREEVVLSALNDAFTGGQARGEQQLSVGNFVNWYQGLLSNQSAKQRVEKYLPVEARDRMKNLYTLAKGADVAGKEFIGTGKIITTLDNFGSEGGVVSKLYNTGTQIAAAEGASTSLGVPGAGTFGVMATTLAGGKKDKLHQAADEMMTDPVFKNMLNTAYAGDSVKAKTKQAAADRALQKSEKYKKWLNRLPNEEQAEIAKIGIRAYLFNEGSEKPPTQKQAKAN